MDRDTAIRLLTSGQNGVSTWNEWRTEQESLNLPDLSGSDLSHSDLSEANLSDIQMAEANLSLSRLLLADLSNANLSEACFEETSLHQANLEGASCTKAIFNVTDLTDAHLVNTDFREAYFSRSNFCWSRLAGANFSNATFSETSWNGVDLSTANGLDDPHCHGPNSIGFDTLIITGELPDEFLLGCGIPETLLDYAKSLRTSLQPIQYYSCFISYSHQDEEFAKRLHGRLRQAGLRIWYAPEDMKSGQKIHHQIDQAIRFHDRLLLVLSDASMRSEWVATEIYKARQLEAKEGRQVLFPIRLVEFKHLQKWESFDSDTGKDMAREVREYFIPDFSDWKNHDQFESSFKRLLADLERSAE